MPPAKRGGWKHFTRRGGGGTVSLSPEQLAALEVAARAELWHRGDLSHLRHSGQQLIHDTIRASPHREHFVLCARRYGKSYEGMLEAIETCQSVPGARVLYLAPWARDAALIAGDTASKLLADCPSDLQPKITREPAEFTFPNGSVIRLKGTNGEHAKYLRGGEAHLVILDECGQMDDLDSIIKGVVMPMTLTTKGRILYLTTPADTPSHDSLTIFDKLYTRGATSVFTLPQAPHIDYEEKARILVDHGESPEEVADILAGKLRPRTNHVRREYWCERIVDRELAVVPDFAEHKAEIVVDTYPRPAHFDAYGAIDPGMRDRTGIVVGYLDYVNQRLVIEGEALLDRANFAEIAATWSMKEAALGYAGHVLLRSADDPSLRVSAELTALGLRTQPVQKAGREAAIAAMNVLVTSGRLRILSQCELLIHQLENAIYKKSESGKQYDFQRDTDGHFDLVDALIYLVRSVIWTRNPFPAGADPRQLHNSDGWARRPARRMSALNEIAFGGTPAGRRLLKRGHH